jgi:type II secretory pathway pseudopilin PulG
MAAPNLTRRDLFYGLLIVGIALAAVARSRVERDRTAEAERQMKQVIETYEQKLREQYESSARVSQQQDRFEWAWGELMHEANELRARLGEPKLVKGPEDNVP